MSTNFNDDNVEIGNNSGNTLNGDNSANYLQGDGGSDVLDANNGNDQLDGGAGHDTIFGDDGADEIYGNTGKDVINGGNGNDTIFGGGGLQHTTSQTGSDPLTGIDATINSYKETFYGGNDSDFRINCSASVNLKTLKFKSWDNGRADDVWLDLTTFNDDFKLKFTKGDANDEVVLYGEGIQINYSNGPGTVTDKGYVYYTGSDGNQHYFKFTLKDGVDFRIENATPNLVYTVTDKADTDVNNDTLNGDGGNDSVIGGQGNDKLYGGAGNDTLYGDEIDVYPSTGGADSLYGGDGNDELFGVVATTAWMAGMALTHSGATRAMIL
jgi:Ca2+-binding RTX toxin-like protein